MIADLKPYPATKDSGVPWLGMVPKHWELRRLKSSVRNINEQTGERRTDDLYVALEHVESWTGRLKPAPWNVSFDSQVKRFRSGDVLFGKLRPYLAKVAGAATSGVCVGEFLVLRPRIERIGTRYAEQLLRSKPIIDVINGSTFGAKMPRADWQFVGNMVVALPSLTEQAAIVRFLDHVDRRIGRYIRAKQKLIKLLEEQKQAIIHHAVTRGLDPNVRLKPSAVAWLGDVPGHWEVRQLRHCVSVVGGMTPSMENRRFWDGPIPWITPKDMKQTLLGDSSVRVSEAAIRETSLRLIQPPAILMVVRGMILARRVPIACTTAPVTVNQDMKALMPVSGVHAEFLTALLSSAQNAFVPLIDEAGHGTRRLPTERWRTLGVALPAEVEQLAIMRYLNEATIGAVTAIGRTSREIDLLREYRTRLVADVVTGKLDVREAAARLPDKVDEPGLLDETETGTDLEEDVVEELGEAAEEVEA